MPKLNSASGPRRGIRGGGAMPSLCAGVIPTSGCLSAEIRRPGTPVRSLLFRRGAPVTAGVGGAGAASFAASSALTSASSSPIWRSGPSSSSAMRSSSSCHLGADDRFTCGGFVGCSPDSSGSETRRCYATPREHPRRRLTRELWRAIRGCRHRHRFARRRDRMADRGRRTVLHGLEPARWPLLAFRRGTRIRRPLVGRWCHLPLGDDALEHPQRARERLDLLPSAPRGHDARSRRVRARRPPGPSRARRDRSHSRRRRATTGSNIFSMSAIERFDLLALGFELLARLALDRVVLPVGDHLRDLVLGEARGRGHRDRLLLAGLEILRVHRHDAVGVDLERDLDLDLPRRRATQTRRAGTRRAARSLRRARSRPASRGSSPPSGCRATW